MNKELFRYKLNFITFCFLLSYTFAHTHLTSVFVDATLEDLQQGTSRLPFGQRLLVPLMARYIHNLFHFSTSDVFFLLELGFVTLFYFTLRQLLVTSFDAKKAQVLSWLFILLLPIVTIINYRLSIGGVATFFYPYDTASLFFIAAGYWCCIEQRWNYLYPILFLATLNRETSILLILLIPALNWQNKNQIIRPFIIASAVYLLTRVLVVWLTSGLAGTRVEWFATKIHFTYFSINLIWLLDMNYLLVFLFCMAGLPLFWFAFYDYIPTRFRLLRYLTLAYFLGLLTFGMFMESRIFEEIIVLLYLPVCIAIQQWFNGAEPFKAGTKHILYYIDRYAVLSALFATIIFREPLNNLVLWFANH